MIDIYEANLIELTEYLAAAGILHLPALAFIKIVNNQIKSV